MLNVLDGLLAEFPFNWFPLREGSPDDEGGAIRFYFSGFPFNWFPLREGSAAKNGKCVTVQAATKFPFNWFPLREGRRMWLT